MSLTTLQTFIDETIRNYHNTLKKYAPQCKHFIDDVKPDWLGVMGSHCSKDYDVFKMGESGLECCMLKGSPCGWYSTQAIVTMSGKIVNPQIKKTLKEHLDEKNERVEKSQQWLKKLNRENL